MPTNYQLLPTILWITAGIKNLPFPTFLVIGICYVSIFYYAYYRLFKQAHFFTVHYMKHITKVFPQLQHPSQWTPLLIRSRQLTAVSILLIELLLAFPLTVALHYGQYWIPTLIILVIGQCQFLFFLNYFIKKQLYFDQILTQAIQTLHH